MDLRYYSVHSSRFSSNMEMVKAILSLEVVNKHFICRAAFVGGRQLRLDVTKMARLLRKVVVRSGFRSPPVRAKIAV